MGVAIAGEWLGTRSMNPLIAAPDSQAARRLVPWLGGVGTHEVFQARKAEKDPARKERLAKRHREATGQDVQYFHSFRD